MSLHSQNIVVFGSTGSGKSSVINMIRRSSEAPVSSGASGCTFQSTAYSTKLQDKEYRLWDTAGLDEGKQGKVFDKKAFENLCSLVGQLSHNNNGVSLLMFVMRGPRITDAATKNYRMFYEGFCRKQVPIVIVVTGLENEDDMDQWWITNEGVFAERNMFFHGAACVTAITGKFSTRLGRGIHADVYAESIPKIEKLIQNHVLTEGWKKSPKNWALDIWKWVLIAFGALVPIVLQVLEQDAVKAAIGEIFDSLDIAQS
ncbi:hypothetical protein D9757_013890 [Collybiopsis confluens]|uniref:G domain-containing protein n=1 Tax=Collybiopsis confluens TaxID=2823264 RepID=A0A8H5CMX1_9AGAR|nr:hypothetical protein D9757_013890 [Collybiopsis confluens]